MAQKLILLALVTCLYSVVSGQSSATYLKNNAIRVNIQGPLSDSVYNLLAPFQIIMVGEMHGTNEPAQLVNALANLFADKGDSVQVGLEIPPGQMTAFLTKHTKHSVYESSFFATPEFESGRESFAWAKIIDSLMNNPKIQLFFFDVNKGEGESHERDSMMYLNLKKQFNRHPGWRMLTISGNVHSMTSPQAQLGYNTMASYLKQDKKLNLANKICSLNNYYLKGACRANFGKGLEERALERPENEYDTTLDFDRYIVLVSSKSTYPYSGIYYTKFISASKMVHQP